MGEWERRRVHSYYEHLTRASEHKEWIFHFVHIRFGEFYNLAFSHLFGVGFFGTSSAFFYLALFLKGSIPAEGKKYIFIIYFIIVQWTTAATRKKEKRAKRLPFFLLNSHNQWHQYFLWDFILFSFTNLFFSRCGFVCFVRVY